MEIFSLRARWYQYASPCFTFDLTVATVAVVVATTAVVVVVAVEQTTPSYSALREIQTDVARRKTDHWLVPAALLVKVYSNRLPLFCTGKNHHLNSLHQEAEGLLAFFVSRYQVFFTDHQVDELKLQLLFFWH